MVFHFFLIFKDYFIKFYFCILFCGFSRVYLFYFKMCNFLHINIVLKYYIQVYDFYCSIFLLCSAYTIPLVFLLLINFTTFKIFFIAFFLWLLILYPDHLVSLICHNNLISYILYVVKLCFLSYQKISPLVFWVVFHLFFQSKCLSFVS